MRKMFRWLFVAFFFIIATSITPENALAQAPVEDEYFEESGHRVTGEFLEMYHSVSDPLRIFGLPITDAFQDSLTGMQVQYFEKARFELDLTTSADPHIRLSSLGHLTYSPGPVISIQGLSSPCRTYAETGYAVCFDFLKFYDQYGGVDLFGLPISGLEDRNGRIVQYFYNARFEWQPEQPAGERVVISDLGREYFLIRSENPQLLAAKNPGTQNNYVKRPDNAILQMFKPEVAVAQAGEQGEYFEETGHWVSGEFLATYRRSADPLRVYGLPITDAYQDSITGLQIQYFDKVRFELHPEAQPDARVQLSNLGYLTYKPGALISNQGLTQPCQKFAETGYSVCFDFLEFFLKFGGVTQFGYPISNLEDRDGRIVQYFYKARLEWRPDMPAGQRVVVSDLGRRYFYIRNENLERLGARLENNAPRVILSLKVRAYPLKAITGQEGSQTIYVSVQDQNLHPVTGASVYLTFNTPGGQVTTHTLPKTDSAGITQFVFSYSSEEYGLAKIWVTSTLNTLKQQTVTSFHVWR